LEKDNGKPAGLGDGTDMGAGAVGTPLPAEDEGLGALLFAVFNGEAAAFSLWGPAAMLWR
jgi:hypothetical protein